MADQQSGRVAADEPATRDAQLPADHRQWLVLFFGLVFVALSYYSFSRIGSVIRTQHSGLHVESRIEGLSTGIISALVAAICLWAFFCRTPRSMTLRILRKRPWVTYQGDVRRAKFGSGNVDITLTDADGNPRLYNGPAPSGTFKEGQQPVWCAGTPGASYRVALSLDQGRSVFLATSRRSSK